MKCKYTLKGEKSVLNTNLIAFINENVSQEIKRKNHPFTSFLLLFTFLSTCIMYIADHNFVLNGLV